VRGSYLVCLNREAELGTLRKIGEDVTGTLDHVAFEFGKGVRRRYILQSFGARGDVCVGS